MENMEFALSITKWLEDPSSRDQNKESKNGFIRTALAGPVTRLHAIGISNPKLRKYASEFYKENITLDYNTLMEEMRKLYNQSKYTETVVLCFFILEKFKKLVKNNSKNIFKVINLDWIDKIDHWTSSDHLCINLVGYLELDEDIIEEVKTWRKSQNFWRRRLSITFFLKHYKGNEEISNLVLEQIDYLKKDKNYYVRKSLPWLMRTVSHTIPDTIEEYLEKNIIYFSKTEIREASRKLSDDAQVQLIELYELSKS